MWFTKTETEPAKSIATLQEESQAAVRPAPAPPEPQITVPEFGERFGTLTRFGSVWIDLAKVESIDFAPADGCGAEVAFTGDSQLHLSDEDGAALQTYLGMNSLKP